MASHVPFLVLRPDDQFSSEVKTRDFATTNSDNTTMDSKRVPAASKLPTFIRFPLACAVSLGLSTVLYSLVAGWAGVELASVSRDLDDDWQIGALVAWKFAGLAVAWYAGYDYQDLSSLAFLANLPYYYLLNTFYSIHDLACITAIVIDIASIAIPFALLRPVLHAHDKPDNKSANQEVAQDRFAQGLLAVFGAAITSAVVYSSFYTWLPTYMVVHFDGLRSVQKAHDSSFYLLIALCIPIGIATTHFIFTPAVGSPSNPGLTDPKIRPDNAAIDPETATLGETIAWNFGLGPNGLSKRAEIMFSRTVALAACTFINTFVRVVVTIEGTEIIGAAGWASVWAAATALTGLAYAWVGNE